MTGRRLLLLGLVVLTGSLIPSAAGGGAAGGGGDDPPQSPPTPPPLGRFLALAAETTQTVFKSFNRWGEGKPVENAQQWLSPSGYSQYLDVLHTYP